MNRERELELTRKTLEVVRARGPYMDHEETSIPVANYQDAARFERERALFARSLNIVGLSTDVAAPGDFITTQLAGRPVLVARGNDGEVRAFLNVCRHRGATVELRDRGRCKAFVCPYHAWTYRTDGTLAHVRHREGFPTLNAAESSLVRLSCLERGGLVWVCPDPTVVHDELDAPTKQIVDELEGLLGHEPTVFATQDRQWHANWKLIVDGGIESYHFRIAHRDTISKLFGDTDSHYELIGDHVRSILPRRSIVGLADVPESQWRLREHAQLLYTVAPNAVFLVQQTHVEMLLSDPLAVDRTRIRLHTIGRAPGPDGYSDKARAFLQGNHDFTVTTLTEDFELAEQIQAGINTGANTHYRFGRFEGALSQWHQRLDARLA